jgi:hypothetical protein
MPDITAQLAAIVAQTVKSHTEKALAVAIQRIEDAERRALEATQRAEDAERKAAEAMQFKAVPGPAGEPGKDGAPGRDGLDGKDGKGGIDGKDGAQGERGEPGPPGRDGMDGNHGADGLDGKDGAPGEKGAPGRDGLDGKDGAPGIQGKDGAPGIDGKDGRDGVDGKSITVDDMVPVLRSMQAEWALDFERRAHELLAKAIDKMPVPKDGKDGMSVKDFDITMDADERTLVATLKAADGTVIERRIKLTHVVGRGVWEAETQYSKGDAVTWDGSMWIAQEDSKGIKPSAYQKGAWKLSVKRGRDGK